MRSYIFLMSQYRRIHRPGASYFFTVNLQHRGSPMLIQRIKGLRAAVAATLREAPVKIDAMVVLPDHLHAVWTLPEGDAAYSERWRKIKSRFTHDVGIKAPRSHSKRRKRECGLWQRRFWEHTIRDAEDYRRHVWYCWANPVKHGLVRKAADWPHSSIHRDIGLGLVDPAWQGLQITGDFGEP